MSSIPCIICGDNIDDLHVDEFNGGTEVQRMKNNGAVNYFSFGYGSRYDADTYLIGICDKCTKLKIKENKMKFISNFFDEKLKELK